MLRLKRLSYPCGTGKAGHLQVTDAKLWPSWIDDIKRASMMRPRTIRIIALVLALMVCLTAFAGWDTVFAQYVMSDWLSHVNGCF